MENFEILNSYDDICILHLSDLHINKIRNSYDGSLKLLIKDIKSQLCNTDEVILVVSGDIINKGLYNEDNKLVALAFFDDLFSELNGKIKYLVMVPGNHDKIRDNVNKLITLKAQEDEELIKGNEWEYQLKAFSGFIEIYNKLLKKYFANSDAAISNTFGVNKIELKDQNLIFIRIDTAWCSCSNDDSYKLRVGKFQAEKLVEEYQKCLNAIDNHKKNLTIGVSHFPISFLVQKEEIECNKLFLSQDKLNLDILLCGHVHDVAIAHYFNHEHSLLTLLTGIGGVDQDNSNEGHRYSIYNLNIANNSCDIIMRKSGKTSYNFDYSIYTGKERIIDNKLVYPIKVTESHPFIRLFSPNPIQTKNKFLDNDLLTLIPSISQALNDFIHDMTHIITMYKATAYDYICAENLQEESNEYLTDSLENIYEYFFLDGEISENDKTLLLYEDAISNFSGFLMEICETLIRRIKDLFNSDIIIRAHFRIYNENNDNYIALQCQSNEDNKTESPKDISWTRIMSAAFESGKIIQFSANPKLNDIDTAWEDFLTIVPRCIDNFYEKITDKSTHKHEKRPCLTFGVSIKKTQLKDINVLSLLSYLKLDEVISHIIDEYLYTFNINLKESLDKLKTIKKRNKNEK